MKSEIQLNRKEFLKAVGMGISAFGLSGCNVFFEPNFEKNMDSLTVKNKQGYLRLKMIRGVSRNLLPFYQKKSTNDGVQVFWDQFKDEVELTVEIEDLVPGMRLPESKNFNPFKSSHRRKIEKPCYQLLLGAIHPTSLVKFYYDANTLDLLGSEHSISELPSNHIVKSLPSQVFLKSPIVGLEPDGAFRLKWKLRFSNVLDSSSTVGYEYVFGPSSIRKEGIACRVLHSKKRTEPLSFNHFLKEDGFVLDANFEQELKVPAMLANFDKPIFF